MPYRVLIVEDSPEWIKLLSEIFEEDLNYEVAQVNTAQNAQKLLFRSSVDDTRFDLVLIDMGLADDVHDSPGGHGSP